ncbi:MAG: efflux RND transporter permease subunit [Syntrophales bacterium]|nr:efflux RND transporter permease subunit [Syntrophales bacterium]
MGKFMIWCARHAKLVIAIIASISIVAGYFALQVRVDSGTEGMMIEGDPAKEYHRDTVEKFGSDNVTVVFIRDKNLFTPEKLKVLENLHYDLKELPNVERCESLFTVTNFKGRNGELETNPLMDIPPSTLEEAKRIQADALRNPLLLDSLISRDGNMTAINLYVNVDRSDPDFHPKFSKKVDEILGKYEGKFDRIFQFGNSFSRRAIAENIISDQLRITPLAVTVLIATLIIALRNLSAGLMPMLTAGTSVLWTLAFMVIVGIPLNVLTVIVPSITIVVGSTEDLHMLSEFMEGIEEHRGDSNKAVESMANKLGMAVLMTALTTFLGFLSIIYNDIKMLVQFGIVSSFALFVNPLITFSLGPAYLRLFGPKKVKHHEEKTHIIDKVFQWIAERIVDLVNNPKKIKYSVAVFAAVTVIALGSILFVKVNNDFIAYFKPQSDLRKRSDTLHRELAGAQTFFIRISSGVPDTFKQSQYLSQVAAIQQYMSQKGWFDKTESLADRVALINREMNGGDPNYFSIPSDSNLIAQYLLFFQRDDLSRFVTPDYSEVVIMVRHNISASYEINKVLEELREYIRKTLNPNFRFEFTGEYILINKAAETLAINSVQSLALLLFVVFLCMYILFWSVKAGLISLIPNVFPIIVIFGVMGIFDIPLNVGTAMVACISIGIAVDDTMHLMSRYNSEMRRLQNNIEAIKTVLKSEIRPVVSTSIALALGFAVCMASNFVPVIQFGLLSAIVMVVALLADLIITPILLKTTQLLTLWELFSLKLREEVIKQSPFFEGLKAWHRKKVCLLGRMGEKKIGERIVVQGEFGNSMFLLLDGEAEVIGRDEKTGQTVTFAKLKPGDIFGEIALVKAGPRSADVVATTPVQYLEIDWEGLKRIQKIYPHIGGRLFLNLSRILGERLVHTNEMLLGRVER